MPIVFADMDGTFLSDDKSIPPQNMSALDLLADRGIPFVPCTGRPVSAVPEAILAHRATRFAIGSNGAVVYDVEKHIALHMQAMDKTRVLELYNRVSGLRATFDVFADGEVYAEQFRYDMMGTFGIDEPTLKVLRRVRKPVADSVPDIVSSAREVEKITCFWCAECDRVELERSIEEVGGFSVAHGHPKNFELQAAGVSKGFGLQWLCDYLGYPVKDAIAFGDEANDIPMLRKAGTGVAMENATNEVTMMASHVTGSNNDAGVAVFLKGLFS